MARCCGGTGTCACRIEAGRNITVTGMGSSGDPYVVASDTVLSVADTDQFDIGLSGNGTLESPWVLSVAYADAAKMTGLPDVYAPAPTNGQVLAYNSSIGQWVPAAPSAGAGSTVTTNTSLTGDGSVAQPLAVRHKPSDFLETTATGIAWNLAAINRTFRVYATAAARTTAIATQAPVLNTVSILNTAPGRLEYWNGTAWAPIKGDVGIDVKAGQLLSLSGAYTTGTRIIQYVSPLSFTADAAGVFEVIPAANLTGYAGVLSVQVQARGTVGWTATVNPDTTRIIGKAFRLDTGAVYNGLVGTGTVTALLY